MRGVCLSGFFFVTDIVAAALQKSCPFVCIHIGKVEEADGKLRQRTAAAGADSFMAVQHMDAAAMAAVVHIHHGRSLLQETARISCGVRQ